MCSMDMRITSARIGLTALLLLASAEAAAQAPAQALAFSSSAVHAFALEHQVDLQAINATETKRSAGSQLASPAKLERWSLFGRLGPLNFTNQLHASSEGAQFSFRKESHGLGGRIYIGLHRRF